VVNKKNCDSQNADWLIPLWLKYATTILFLGSVTIFIRSLFAIKTIFSLSPATVIYISLAFVIFSTFVQVNICFFPKGKSAIFIYWFLRLIRVPICVFSLFGLVYLLTIHTPLFSLRGAGLIIVLLSILSMGILTKPNIPNHFPIPGMKSYIPSMNYVNEKIAIIPRWILILLVSLLPIVIVCSVVYFGLHSKLSTYRPYSFWNDETSYWLRIRAFSWAGLNVGNFGSDELVPRAGFNHFGENSPLYFYIYGLIAKLVGWSPELPLLINFVILSLAIIIFILFTHLDSLQIILTGLVIIFTWPILLYLLTTSQETLNQVIGIILAGILYLLMSNRNKIGWGARIIFILFCSLATLIRLSWGLILIPVLFYSFNGSIFRRGLFSIILGVSLYLGAIILIKYLVPPVNNSIFQNLGNTFSYGPQALLTNFRDQLVTLTDSRKVDSNIAVVFLIITIVGWNIFRLVKQVRSRTPLDSIMQSQVVLDIYLMTLLLVAGFIFYFSTNFFRTFTPSILVVYLLHVAKKDYKMIGMLLVLNLAFFPLFINHQNSELSIRDFTKGYTQRDEMQAKMNDYVVYDPLATNPWCNTMLVPLNYYDYRLTIISPGIGVSILLHPHSIQSPIKSNFLLLDQETYAALYDRLHVVLLESLPIGDLYRNLDAECDAAN
jgi:hypothetical protein